MTEKEEKRKESKAEREAKENSEAEQKETETAEEIDVVEEANRAAQEMKELAQRVQAEFDNYRKRNNEAVKIARQDGENTVLSELFRVTDNFERAIEQVDEKSREGVNLIFRQITGIFEKFGAEEIKAQGEEFNPVEHNAVMTVDDGENADKVVEVLQKGYRRGGKVLRTAMVKVAK